MSLTKKKAIWTVTAVIIIAGTGITIGLLIPPNVEDPQISDPILITSDNEFSVHMFSGNGSAENPYIIENLTIEARGSMAYGISIKNTHVFFIIRNCYVKSEYIGINVLNIAPNTAQILNNYVESLSGDGGGIGVGGSNNCTIIGNTATNFAQGIHLNEASLCLIQNNIIYNNTYQGINIRYSSDNIVVGNTISNHNQHGLALVGTSNNNLLYNNILTQNGLDQEYSIDGERTGEIFSQAYDEGANNLWYHAATEQGNWWGDYQGAGAYPIDGPSGSVDSFPNN